MIPDTVGYGTLGDVVTTDRGRKMEDKVISKQALLI